MRPYAELDWRLSRRRPSAFMNEHGEVREYLIGRLRAGREQNGMSVRGLARAANVSPSFISQIENGKANPSVGTLLSIVSALGISLDELFSGSGLDTNLNRKRNDEAVPEPPLSQPVPDGGVLRAADRRSVNLAGGVRWERLTPGTDPNVTFLHVQYDVGGSSSPPDALMQHSGREYGVVLSGLLGAQIGADTYQLEPGDSIATDCSTPHRFWTIGDEPAVVVWAIIGGGND